MFYGSMDNYSSVKTVCGKPMSTYSNRGLMLYSLFVFLILGSKQMVCWLWATGAGDFV